MSAPSSTVGGRTVPTVPRWILPLVVLGDPLVLGVLHDVLGSSSSSSDSGSSSASSG